MLDVTNWAVQSYDDLCESSPPGAVCVGVGIGRTVDASPSTEKVDNVGRSDCSVLLNLRDSTRIDIPSGT